MHLVHTFDVVSYLLVKPIDAVRLDVRNIDRCICPHSISFFQGLEPLFQDTHFDIGLKIVLAGVDMLCKIVVVGPGLRIIRMIAKSCAEFMMGF